ncbi:MAG: protein-export chaperone SecB [Stellaceae bacterium]
MADAPTPRTDPAAPAPSGVPQLIVNAQYVKDLSFENPRAPQSLMPQPQPPEIKLDVRVDARNMGPDTFEVTLSVAARATRKEEPVFLSELTYAAVVTLHSIPQGEVQFYILVETPRLMFPFVRALIADATRDGGFPPLFIQPIDFAELLRRQQQQQQAGIASQAPAGTA